MQLGIGNGISGFNSNANQGKLPDAMASNKYDLNNKTNS